jgi:hypothetical protein
LPVAVNAWLPIEPLLHCITLSSPKVIVLDIERLNVLSAKLPSLRLSVILVRPPADSFKPVSGVRIKEWNKALSSYTGPIDAWKKEPEIIPEDNAAVTSHSSYTFALFTHYMRRFSLLLAPPDSRKEFFPRNVLGSGMRSTLSQLSADQSSETAMIVSVSAPFPLSLY